MKKILFCLFTIALMLALSSAWMNSSSSFDMSDVSPQSDPAASASQAGDSGSARPASPAEPSPETVRDSQPPAAGSEQSQSGGTATLPAPSPTDAAGSSGFSGSDAIRAPLSAIHSPLPEPAPSPTPPPTPPSEPATEPATEPSSDAANLSAQIITLRAPGNGTDPSRPMLALTFDDGPSQYTPEILDLLEQYGGRATFFVVGNRIEDHREIIGRASRLGCEILGHSWNHRYLTRLSEEDIATQLLETLSAIESVTGIAARMFRPTYGAVNDMLRSVSAELGFAMIYWSVDPQDWRTRDAESTYSSIMLKAGNGSVIICHDVYPETVMAMADVIPDLISSGYQLVTVSELMYYVYGTLEAGRIYSGR